MTATTAPPVTTRLLAAAAADLSAHVARLGPLPAVDASTLIDLIGRSGLSGRGGAAFPTALKLAAVAAGGTGVVVANGSEGEPASSKDRWLLTHAPHLVLDGLELAARAVGAHRAVIYAAADLLAGPVGAALRERQCSLSIRTVPAPDTFVAGQESAVVNMINRGDPRPTTTPPPVYRRGVDGRPTLVQNVETLAQLALIVRYGPGWFRSIGTPDEPGTRLLTVSGAVGRPGVYELAAGAPLGTVMGAAGGTSEPVQALLVGGYHGGWVPWTYRTADVPLTRAALAPFEAAPGAGVVIALSARACGLRAAADVAAYLAGQSAAQCGPCRNGLPLLARHLRTLAGSHPDPGVVAEIRRVTGLVAGRGACAHPDGTVRQARSALVAFAADVEAHRHGSCTAGQAART